MKAMNDSLTVNVEMPRDWAAYIVIPGYNKKNYAINVIFEIYLLGCCMLILFYKGEWRKF